MWNRNPEKSARLAALGAQLAENVDAVFEQCDVILLMLSDEAAIDEVLQRSDGRIGRRLPGRTLVLMSTVAPPYSAGLATDVSRAGGRYVEAPVSGSRGPAERGELVVLIAGEQTRSSR